MILEFFIHLVFRKPSKSNVNDLKLAADACLPLINAVLNEIKAKTYPENSFLNVDIPSDVANNKVIIGIRLRMLF